MCVIRRPPAFGDNLPVPHQHKAVHRINLFVGGLDVLDVSNPANPVRVRYGFNYGAEDFGVALAGNYAYLPYGYTHPTGPTTTYTEGGMDVRNLSNPTNPVSVGIYRTNVWASHPVAVSGNYAYIYMPGASPRFQVIDISNPASPVRAGGDNTGVVGLAASGDYVYAASGDLGLQILCINCPRLSAEPLGNQVLLKWPASATNYLLETASKLPPTRTRCKSPPSTSAAATCSICTRRRSSMRAGRERCRWP